MDGCLCKDAQERKEWPRSREGADREGVVEKRHTRCVGVTPYFKVVRTKLLGATRAFWLARCGHTLAQ